MSGRTTPTLEAIGQTGSGPSPILATGMNVLVSPVVFDSHVHTTTKAGTTHAHLTTGRHEILASRPYESRFDQPYATNVKDVEACQTVGGPICLGSPFVFNDDKASSVGAQQHRGWPCRKRRTLLHRVRSRCTRAVALRSLMIGTIVTVLLLIYAWNVDNLWMSEFARVGSGLGHWDPSSGRTGSSGEVAEVRRRWLHSHNDEMRGKDALTLALDLGFGSIEIDTWLGKTPTPSSATKPTPRKRSLLNVRPLADLFQPSVYDDSYYFLPMERRWRKGDDVAARGHVGETVEHDRRLSLFLPMERRGLVPEHIEHDAAVKEKQAEPTPDPAMTLLTGHKVKDLSDHTLAGLYLQPLLARLDKNNEGRRANESIVGLYPEDPDAEVQIVIDMKSDGDMIWPYLTSALKPFQDKGYLTTYDTTTGTWSRSALTIVGTGNTPLHRVYHSRTRMVFYDAPLMKLAKAASIPATGAGPAATFEWDNTIAPMASAKFPLLYHIALGLPPWNPVVQRLLRHTSEARERGISSRWWGAARIPEWTRRRLWAVQKQGGATWTNADDLVDAGDWLSAWEAR